MANDINILSNTNVVRPGKGETKTTQTTSVQPQNSAPTPLDTRDLVEVSESALQLQRLQDTVKDLPSVDMNKVAEIKQAIQSGNYKIDADSIANKIIDSQEK